MKRILSLFMCIMLICTTIVVPAVSVSADVSYADYVPGEMPENMFRTINELGGVSYWWANMGTIGDSAGKVSRAQTNGYKGTSITAKGTPGGVMEGTAGAWYQVNAGVFAGQKLIKTNIVNGREGDLDDGKNYVYAMQVKNLDPTYTPNVRFLLYDLDGPAELNAKEWGAEGMPVTSTEWMDFRGTIQAPERNKEDTVNDVDRISIGFNADAVAGSSIDMNFTAEGSGMYPLYFAEETVYDISNTIVTESYDIEKEALVLKAEVLNQVGLPGYLNQEFTWIALDSKTRTKEINGINIEVSDDTTMATVTADEEVGNGFYDIVAYSEEYGMAKGVTVAVGEVTQYPDYVPSDEMPANLVANNMDANNFTGRWLATFEAIAPTHANGVAGAMRYPITAAPQYWGDSSSTPLAGGEMTRAIGTYKWKATNYVVSTDLMNSPDSPVQESRFMYMIDSRDASGASKPYEMLTITSSEWQTFNFVLPVTVEGTSSSKLHYGYPNHSSLQNPQGTDILHRLGSFYIAEEVAKDINITANETQMLEGGELTFEVEITNQLDIPYCGETNVSWMVMDADRVKPAKGFSIVELDENTIGLYSEKGVVQGGRYQVVAIDETLGIEGFCKGVEFTVIPYYNEDLGSMNIRGKLNTQDSEWSSDKVTTGLATKAIVEAEVASKDGDFAWYALDEDRVSKVDGFSFDVVKDGNKETATVNLANTVVEGTYYIVAESADSSELAGMKLVVDKSGDIVVIKEIIASGNKADIETGLHTTFLGILELANGFASKADKSALAAILASSAEEEKIADTQTLSELQSIVERLALVSMYNVPVDGVELTDEEGNFKYASQLNIADKDGVTINSVFNTTATTQAKAKVMENLTGNGYTTWSAFAKEAKEAMVIYTLAYPDVNGIEYVALLLTKANLEAIGIDTTKYAALKNPQAFNDKIAGVLYTVKDLKDVIEKAKDVSVDYDDEEDEDDRKSGGSSGGGGGFRVSKTEPKDEVAEENEITAPETYSFADVPKSHWAYADIHYLKSIGVINGVDANNYAPNANVTREQFLKIIIEAFGIELSTSETTFSDVKAGTWYAPYVAAGVANGIINGMGDNTFGTGKPITRQDACTILAKALNIEDSTEGDIDFTDAESIAPYARPAVSALSGYAIINGMGDGSFAPTALCTRAQAAKIVSSAIGIVNALKAADGR